MTNPTTRRELRAQAIHRLRTGSDDLVFLTDTAIGATEQPPVVYVATARRGGACCVVAVEAAEWARVDPLKTDLCALLGFAPAAAPTAMQQARRRIAFPPTAKALA